MSSSGGRVYVDGARWTSEMEVIFIDLMYEEFLRGNLLGGTFSKSIWLDLEGRMHALGGYYSAKQLREKLVRIKIHWKKFRPLMASDSGLGWDNERGLPTVYDTWWDLWEQAHPNDVGLRNKPCRGYEKLCSMFNRSTASGNRARSLGQLPPRVNVGHNIDKMEPNNLDNEEDWMDDAAASGFMPASTLGSSKKRRRKVNPLEKLVDSFEKSNKTITSKLEEMENEREIIQKQCDDCMDAVHKLPNVTMNMTMGAMDLFVEPAKRAMFLRATPEEQFAYLKSKFG